MKTNPIARRLSVLSDQWAQFRSDPAARLLCWQLTAAEVPMFEAFLAIESDEQTAEHADFFVSLAAPFSNEAEHGRVLCQKFVDGFADGADELREQGVAIDWQLPAAVTKEQDTAFLVRACKAFVASYELKGLFVWVLRPREISDAAAYRAWLERLARTAPACLRVLVLDDEHHAVHAGLVAAVPGKVVALRAALDMPGALQQLSDEAGGLDTPGGKFRDLFVRLGNALSQGDIERALPLGAAAIELMRGCGLWHLAVPVHVALAGALLGAKRGEECLAHYVAAEADAQLGMASEDGATSAVCKTLHLQSRLGHGAALIALGSFRQAASIYEQTAPLAAAAEDLATTLDCHRLASFCHECDASHDRAWLTGLQGLGVAGQMSPSARAISSLPYLVEALRRLAKDGQAGAAKQLERALAELQPTATGRA